MIGSAISEDQFTQQYGRIWEGDERWAALPTPTGPAYEWDPDSTYVREPPFFEDLAGPVGDASAEGSRVEGAEILVKVGDSITTDHISPAGAIRPRLPGGHLPGRARCRAARLQLVRRPPREPRGDDARDVRQRPAPQRAGARPGGGGRRTFRPARSRASTRRRGVTARTRRSGCSRARSTAAGRRATGPRRGRLSSASGSCSRSRSSGSPAEPRGDGCPPAPVQDRRVRRDASPHGAGDVLGPRPRDRHRPGAGRDGPGRARGRHDRPDRGDGRIDQAAEVGIFGHGGILPMVLRETLTSA